MPKTYILTVKDGKDERKFKLNKTEFDEFCLRFEENELVDMPDFDLSGIKLVKVDPPRRQNSKNKTKRVVLFDELTNCCQFYSDVNEDYCAHDCNVCSVCSAYDCPLGRNAEKEDVTDKSIDWNGLCRNGNGDVYDGNQYFILDLCGDNAEDAKLALENYEKYLNEKGEK